MKSRILRAALLPVVAVLVSTSFVDRLEATGGNDGRVRELFAAADAVTEEAWKIKGIATGMFADLLDARSTAHEEGGDDEE